MDRKTNFLRQRELQMYGICHRKHLLRINDRSTLSLGALGFRSRTRRSSLPFLRLPVWSHAPRREGLVYSITLVAAGALGFLTLIQSGALL
jgi:hypothetical protein